MRGDRGAVAQDAVIVCGLGVHRKVQAGALLLLVRAEADRPVHSLPMPYVTRKAYASTATTATSCLPSWARPPPYRRPSVPPVMDSTAKTPMRRVPMTPSTRGTPTTSRESSWFSLNFRLTAYEQTTPAARPMTRAPDRETEPQDGVMATRPATAPEAGPRVGGAARMYGGAPWIRENGRHERS